MQNSYFGNGPRVSAARARDSQQIDGKLLAYSHCHRVARGARSANQDRGITMRTTAPAGPVAIAGGTKDILRPAFVAATY